MSFELLVPLGLLGLIGIAVLIIIYLIRPNYQTKAVTSTYIWKLSLNYKRRRPPVNRIRNIILFICQLLILTAMALIMAWPSLVDRNVTDDTDVIYILDASASMHAETEGVTRFDRALEQVRGRADSVLTEDGRVTVIVANGEPYFLARRVDSSRRMKLLSDLDTLASGGASYAVADVDSSLALAKQVLLENPSAQLVFFTDTKYGHLPDRVNVELIRDDTEWNAAILNAQASLEDGYYTLTVQVASYGISQELNVSVYVDGANAIPASANPGETISFDEPVDCNADAVKTVIFRVGGGQDGDDLHFYDMLDTEKFFSYESIRIGIEADDSYAVDNVFYLYGGIKQRIKVEYFSGGAQGPNPFIQTALAQAGNALAARNNFELDITEIKWHADPILEGFDLYIFEHEMPAHLPTDGAILLLDPDPTYDKGSGAVAAEAGFTVSQVNTLNESVSLAEGEDFEGHPVMRYIMADNIEITSYDSIVEYDSAYDVLLSYDSHPMLMVRNDGANKIGVMSFSIHNSTLAKLPENFLLMYSLIEYFFPTVLSGSSFEVGEEFTLNAWGESITLTQPEQTFSAEELPATLSLDIPGSYRFTQTTYYSDEVIATDIFIRPPAAESNILKTEDSLADPYEGTEPETFYRDLLIILASVLVGLLFVEWFLHARENR